MSPLAPPDSMQVLPFEQQDRLSSKKLKVASESDTKSYVELRNCYAELYGQIFLFHRRQDLLNQRLIRLKGKRKVIDDVILSLSANERVANIAFHIREDTYYVSFDCVEFVGYK